jgi:hypothetical protein
VLVPARQGEESRPAFAAPTGKPIEEAKKSVEQSPMRPASVTTAAGWTIQLHAFLFGTPADFLI